MVRVCLAPCVITECDCPVVCVCNADIFGLDRTEIFYSLILLRNACVYHGHDGHSNASN